MKKIKSKLEERYKHYFMNLVLIWLAILFYRFNSHYVGFLRTETQSLLFYLGLTYTVVGFLYYTFINKNKIVRTKGAMVLSSIWNVFVYFIVVVKKFDYSLKHPYPKLSKEEKTAFLFLLVKLFFLPLMLNFLIGNFESMVWYYNNWERIFFFHSVDTFNNVFFPFMISVIFFIDVLYFSFGYLFEASFLGNKVRSVEPTIFGWFVALICYPPFNTYYTNIVGWYANDHVMFSTSTVTMYVRILILVLFFIYVWASIALGTRCSNLTNRGIVVKGPYRFVRHPAYISKNMAWWITTIPVFGLSSVIGMGAWSLIYYFRAITEERHLMADDDYKEYCKKVKYKFIPFVW